MVSFDEVLRHLGEFGRYQKWVFYLLCLPAVPHAFRMMINVYLLNVPAHRCAIPGYDNDTYAVQSSHHANLINDTIPYEERDGTLQYDQCHLYSPTNSTVAHNRTEVTCDRWVYDKSVFESTAATEMNMVCSRSLEAPNAQAIFMGGYLVGATLFGAIGDKIGRRKTITMSIMILSVSGISLNWAPNFTVFVLLRFINGACTAGMLTTCFVLCMEFIGPSKRVWAGIIHGVFFAMGYTSLTGIAYFVRDWHTLQLITATPVIIFLTYWWVIPESPRWLMSKSRGQEADVIIRYAASVNKVTLPESVLEFDKKKMDPLRKHSKASIFQLFTSRVLLLRTMVIFFTWMVVSLAYFGLSANTDNLGAGSLHLNTFLSSIVEYPASVVCLLLLDRIGRKKLLCAFMIIGGSACMSTVITILYVDVDHQWITVALSMAGKLCISGAFGVVYLYSMEIFPTVVRNSAMGLSSSMARVGGMIAPYFLDLGVVIGGDYGRALPMMLFGILSVSAGLCDLTLPETLNRDLPETIEDSKNFNNRKWKITNVLNDEDSDDQDDDLSDDDTRSLISRRHHITDD